MTAVNVLATRWSGGWELEIDEDHHTQVNHLSRARQQVVDYLDTIDEAVDHSDWDITITPDVASYGQVKEARAVNERIASLQQEAAAAWRKAALSLRAEGLSIADTATIMGISKGRVSQLTASA